MKAFQNYYNSKQLHYRKVGAFLIVKMNKYNKVTLFTPSHQKNEKAKSSSKTQGSEQQTEANLTMPLIFNQLLGHGERSSTLQSQHKHFNRIKTGSFSISKSKQTSRMTVSKEVRRPLTQNFLQDQSIDVSLPHPILTLKPIRQLKGSIKKDRKYDTSKSIGIKNDKNNKFFSKTSDVKATHKRNLTVYSQKPESSRTLTQSQKKHQAKMNEISRCFTEQKLYQRLCIYSKQTVKSSLRVYKEDLQKLIIQRYGKDRVTTFLDTQYIQDYNSVKKTAHQLFKFTQEEVLVFVFLIMDQNADGLITPGDLINFIGATNEKVFTNPLIMEDLYEIMRYLKKKHQRQESLSDSLSYEYEQLTDETLSLMKFRIFKFQKMKSANDQEGMIRRKKLITGSIRDRLFTLKEEKQQIKYYARNKLNNRINSVIDFILKGKKRTEARDSDVVPIQFAVNFQSFKQIFNQKIPRTFVDFLFLLAGVEVPKAVYIPIDASILIKNVALKTEVEEEKGLTRFRRMLRNMKSFSEQSSVVYHKLINDSI